MALLTRTERRRLIEALVNIPRLSTPSGRNTLLVDLPPALSTQLERSNDKALDLEIIVNTCNEWEPDPRTTSNHPLQLIIEAAYYWARGGHSGIQLEELLATVTGRLAEITSPTSRPPCPYPGMAPFRAEDARYFKGRRRDIEDMMFRLHQRHLLVVIGPSGSGKSSLVSAGLIPTLADRQPGVWNVVLMQPGAQPTKTLSELLGRDVTQLDSSNTRLSSGFTGQHRLLIVDPFEEVFTLTEREEQSRLITALNALRRLDSYRILLLLRADFYPELMMSSLWPVEDNDRIEIRPLRDDSLREAILEPAAEVHVQVEEGLVQRLLADAAAEPGCLPLLQETLQVLWDRMDGRVLSLRAYQELGREGHSGLAVALAMKADATWDALTPSQQALARRIFLRLIQFGEGRGYSFGSSRGDIRRRQSVEDLRALGDDTVEFDATLALLTQNRLLSRAWEETGGAKMVDLTHDALIVGWPRLQGWLKERREAEQTRRRFESLAAEWEHSGRRPARLLGAEEVREIERWLAGPYGADLGYSEALMALVEASREAVQAAKQRNESAYRGELVELEARADDAEARALAAFAEAEREKLAARHRELQLAQSLIAATSSQNVLQLRAVRSLALTTIARAELDHDPEIAVLLGVEAILATRRWGEPLVPEAVDGLHQGLLRLKNRLTLRGHEGRVYSSTYSLDGKTILTASEDQTVKVWDAETGQVRVTFWGHTDIVRSAAYSPDMHRVVTASFDRTARVWDPEIGAPTIILAGHQDRVHRAVFSPDGRHIATASADGTAKIWDAATGEEVYTLHGRMSMINATYAPDGQSLLTLTADGTVQVWSIASSEPHTILPDLPGAITAVYNPDGRLLVVASLDGMAQIWDLRAKQKGLCLRGRIDRLRAVSYSPDGHYIVTANRDGTTVIWDAATAQPCLELRGHKDAVENALYSPDSTSIVTVGADQTVRMWNAQTGQERITLHGLVPWSGMVTYSPDGRWLAAVSEDAVVRQYPTEPSQLLALAAASVSRQLTAEERALYLAEDVLSAHAVLASALDPSRNNETP